jgi:hypothetical protein
VDMKVVPNGPFREARGYLSYVAALLYPGRSVPVFEQPPKLVINMQRLSPSDKALLIEEGRTLLANQADAMGRNQTRAATLLTIAVAELVFLAKAGGDVIAHRGWPYLPWTVGLVVAALSLAGAVSVLTSSAVYGGISADALVRDESPVVDALATQYLDALGPGEATNAARLTVLRDAVWLAVLAGVMLIVVFAAKSSDPPTGCSVPTGFACLRVPADSPSRDWRRGPVFRPDTESLRVGPQLATSLFHRLASIQIPAVGE